MPRSPVSGQVRLNGGLLGAVTRLDSYRGSLFLPERSHARNAYEELALLN